MVRRKNVEGSPSSSAYGNFLSEHQEKKVMQKETFSDRQENKPEKRQKQKKNLQRRYARASGHNVQKSEEVKTEEIKSTEISEAKQNMPFHENLYSSKSNDTDDTGKKDTFHQPVKKSYYRRTRVKKEKKVHIKANEENGSNTKEDKVEDLKEETFGHDVQKFEKEEKDSENVSKKNNKKRKKAAEKKKAENEFSSNTKEDISKDFKEETFEHDGQKSEKKKEFTGSDDSKKKQHSQKKTHEKSQTEEKKKTDKKSFSENTQDNQAEFQKESGDFTETDTFIPSKKLQKLEKEVEKAGEKLDKERAKLSKKTYRLERVFDEEEGKGKYVLKPAVKDRYPKESFKHYVVRGLVNEGKNFTHGKIAEVEKENVGVEAAHKAEQVTEGVYEHFFSRRGRQRRLHKKIKKATKQKIKADTDFAYEKFLEENPEVSKKFLQKRLQKKRIKREYAKAYREKNVLERTKEFATILTRKIQEVATKKAALIGIIAVIAMVLVLTTAMTTLGGAMLGDIITTTMASSYLSQPEDIDAAELFFTDLEMELQNEIDNIEATNPNYDEYRYNVGAIGHDPFALISYLSAIYSEFTFNQEIENQIEELFDEMYTLTLTPRTEIRTRTETVPLPNPETGEETTVEVEVEYEVEILEVSLSVIPLETLVAMKMDTEQKELYQLYMETKGNLQQFASPLDLHWYYYISSYYGYRKNPVSGQEQFHRGLDIAVPEGTPVYATHTGIVVTAAYDSSYGNYVVITNEEGYTTKYAHLSSLNVSAGQSIEVGTQIGTTGNTGSSSGSHLHLEVLYEGNYYNPLFYFDVGENTLHGETSGIGGGAGNVIPPESYDDATVQTLMTEAEKYLGMPYTFGGTPPRSFDCSAFVCWVFTNSGVHNLPRTTAQGIYDQCTPVPASEAKAGDIIFFTGTYNAGRPVTHVGIYCGNGIMIHCGDPIQYASINTSYWQSHFYAFGRLN